MANFLYFFLEWIAGITYLVWASFKYWLADGADMQIVTRLEIPFFFLGVVPGVGIVVAEASYFISSINYFNFLLTLYHEHLMRENLMKENSSQIAKKRFLREI